MKPQPKYKRGDRVLWGTSAYTIASACYLKEFEDWAYRLANSPCEVFAYEIKPLLGEVTT